MVALAPCGTTLTEDQAATLRELPGAAGGIVAASDADPAGRNAVDRAWQLLRRQRSPGPLLTAEFSAGADPPDLLLRTTAGRSCGPRCSGRRDRCSTRRSGTGSLGPSNGIPACSRTSTLVQSVFRTASSVRESGPGSSVYQGRLASLPDIADGRYSR
ncbi:toprim domain-containing protein [Micromonospora aurantiaca (nom. illeg.)]|uniref:toprim domain-containing protein n=1 Tax=Micromonospora aurantiaca (nom. illeg.) TaxID=47850 RepID=UPI0037A5F77E